MCVPGWNSSCKQLHTCSLKLWISHLVKKGVKSSHAIDLWYAFRMCTALHAMIMCVSTACNDYVREYCMQWLCAWVLHAMIMCVSTACNDYVREYCMQWLCAWVLHAMIMCVSTACNDYVREYCMQWLCAWVLHAMIMCVSTACNDYVREYCMQWLCAWVLHAMIMCVSTACNDYVREYCMHALDMCIRGAHWSAGRCRKCTATFLRNEQALKPSPQTTSFRF